MMNNLTRNLCPYCGNNDNSCDSSYPHPKNMLVDYDGAISELQAVIDTGLLSSVEYEDLEADICSRITTYWTRPSNKKE